MKTYTYYIYHIPGIKIGCTTNLEFRINAQGFNNYQILWQQDGDYEFGWVAGNKEIELQKEYGYKVDRTHYQITRIKNNSQSQRLKTSNSMKLNQNRLGKIHTSDSKLKMSESAFKRINPNRSNEAKLNLAKGQINSDKTSTKKIVECPNCARLINNINLTRHIKACKNKKAS